MNRRSQNVLRIRPLAEADYYVNYAKHARGPLMLLDCERLCLQYARIQQALPGVKIFYAVKSLPHPVAIQTLRDLGAGFDIASSGEVDLMRAAHVFARNCIHTHPIKNDAEIRAALRMGCTTFVIDNPYELEKFSAYKNRVGLLLRVSFRHQQAVVDLSKKFGCSLQQLPEIIEKAGSLGIHIKGLSFHVGSQCSDASKHVEAINECVKFMLEAKSSYAQNMHILDIGGGFPVNYQDPQQDDIYDFCAPIRQVLQNIPKRIRVIAEPGRYLSAPIMTAVSTVIGKALRDGQMWYYLNDGVYGSYSGQIFDHTHYPLTVFSDAQQTLPSVLTGPTCDSIDVIAEQIELPELNIGDVVVGEMMGAYTWATSTHFNSLPNIEVKVLNQKEQVVLLSQRQEG